MANDLTGVSLWKLDTAGSIWTKGVRIAKLVLEPANAEDYALIRVSDGGPLIAKLKAGADTSMVELDFPAGRLLPSFYLDSLSSGAVLWVYLWR